MVVSVAKCSAHCRGGINGSCIDFCSVHFGFNISGSDIGDFSAQFKGSQGRYQWQYSVAGNSSGNIGLLQAWHPAVQASAINREAELFPMTCKEAFIPKGAALIQEAKPGWQRSR